MWMFILFLGIADGVSSEEIYKKYCLDIDNGILKNVKPTEEMVIDYDLSNLSISLLDRNAFDDLVDAKTLSLANNSLKSLPEFVFSNLTQLENLSLANNELSNFANTFIGLNKLKTLNISNNSLRHLRKSYFYGLTSSTEIITEGNELWSISTVITENPFLREVEITINEELKENNENTMISDEIKSPTLRNNYDSDNGTVLDKMLRVKACIENGLLKSVDELKTFEVLPDGCTQAAINYKQRALILKNFKIRNFLKGWYQLYNFPFNSIDLSNNDILEITPELLNHLPLNIAYVNLADNEIVRVRKDVIENGNLKVLNFKDNFIVAIEDDAFGRTNLSGLFLIGNKLTSLKFAQSLPASLHEIVLSKNSIEEIPDGSFLNLKQLVYLNLAQNRITEIQRGTFSGLLSLEILILIKNQIANIEVGSFNDLTNLRTLYLYYNSIGNLANGTWTGMENLKDLNLAWNKLTHINKDMFMGLPLTLRDLHVDYNEITQLEVNSFVQVPKFTLSLDGNKISNISKGTFDLPNLQELYLRNNSLETIDGDSFDGLPSLRRLLLNANRISVINKGATKHMNRVRILDVSKNPIKYLKSGTLYGLPKTKGSFVYVSNTPLKMIQVGVFEDV